MTAEELALLGITAPEILRVWSWGFGSVISMWLFGYVVGVALTMIRKL